MCFLYPNSGYVGIERIFELPALFSEPTISVGSVAMKEFHHGYQLLD